MYIHHFTRVIFENDPYGFHGPISVEDAADSLENFRADYSDREIDELDEGERQFVEDMNDLDGETLAGELNYLFAEQLIESALLKGTIHKCL